MAKDNFEEDEDAEEAEIIVDATALAAARKTRLSSVIVSVVAALVNVLIMAAQGSGAFSASKEKGDVFDELIQLSGKAAAKTLYQRGTDTSSKLTGCLVSATGDKHANTIVKLAPRCTLTAQKVTDIRISGDPRALSFINGVNNLTIDSRFFPSGDFNYHEPSHRFFLARSFLIFFSLYIPLKDNAFDGLELCVLSTYQPHLPKPLNSSNQLYLQASHTPL